MDVVCVGVVVVVVVVVVVEMIVATVMMGGWGRWERACGFVGPGEGELDSLAGPAVGEPRGQAEEGRSGCSGDSHLNEPVEARRLMSRGGGGDDVPKERG